MTLDRKVQVPVRGRLQFKFLPTPSDVFDFSKKLGKAFIKST